MKNVILIGMPGCGKSTIGVILAKTMGKSFIDTDLVIQSKFGRLLQEIVDENGIDRFIQIEADILATIEAENAVIATGGSAIYLENAMTHLKQIGYVVYIKLSLGTIEQRLDNISTRGIAMRPGETLKKLYDIRVPLYERYADFTVDGENKTVEQVVEEICSLAKV